jgi:hypothetical protein
VEENGVTKIIQKKEGKNGKMYPKNQTKQIETVDKTLFNTSIKCKWSIDTIWKAETVNPNKNEIQTICCQKEHYFKYKSLVY